MPRRGPSDARMTAPYRLDRALILVSGPDTANFLNTLLTQNLGAVGATPSYAALLTPQGKVLADMFAWTDGDGALLDLDPLRRVDVLQRLTMYKLRAQVTLEDVTGRFRVLWAPAHFPGATADPRLPDAALGWRTITADQIDLYNEGDAAYDAHRLALGVPDLARDAKPEEVFALEALLDELRGVDFQKGCFVGQENASRMKRRATTRKKFCPVTFEGEAPAYGAIVCAGDAEIGEVRSGGQGRAMAFLRLDRAIAVADSLHVDGRSVRLAPPSWLALPPPSA